MSDDDNAIQVNFARPMPLFPLDSAVLLPQQVLPLHIFEPRYRQMVEHAIDGSGQIAMAVFEGDAWKQQYHGKPRLRPAVCLGQIVQHERLPDGRFNILLQGVCRARILKEMPAEGERLYRLALLEPVGVDQVPDEAALAVTRQRLERMLSEGELTKMAASEPILKYVQDESIPTLALLELLSFAVVTDAKTRYRLLAEGDIATRAELVEDELERLRRLIRRAALQRPQDWPKGCSWN
ncbi:MAG: LON peptidase substrate-binding domain-containing protein [Planctomycetota bacterium]|nr:LON peptidase substrate-binding domain-containing protein [Planctomycetota bacterium]